jgi:hypothetical protein
MKKKSTSKSAFFNLRVLLAAVVCLAGIAVALFAMGAFSSAFAQGKRAKNNRSATNQDSPGSQTPDVVRLVGPVRLDQDLRTLPYVPNEGENEERRLTINPFPLSGGPRRPGTSAFPQSQSLLQKIFRPLSNMPPPLLTFDGTDRVQSGCNCRPPDTQGDVGPNHYVQTVNSGFRVFDKSGNPLTPFTTYNSFFNGTGTPCDDANQGDPFVFYDQLADRWVVSDFAFPAFPGNSFWQCIAVSQSPDPVAGPWIQYALQIDSANPTFLGDYPKLALWNNPQPGGAYYLSVNLFSPGFEGNRVFALDRGSMLSGGPANAIAFTIPVAAMPMTFSAPIPAGFRTGNPPPAGRDEFLLTVDSPNSGGVILTQVHGWFFHADFVTPANSTFGVGPNHLPNAEITVNGFVDAFTDTTTNLVPQQGGQPPLDTLGDRIMTPVVYQNRNGTESLWADHTIILNYPNGPTAVRWYQFNVTGGNFPATPAQQQDWSNGNDGLFRWMPSLAVDQNGNMAIGYSTSSANDFPDIRYAGRFASDPPNDLGQGEATMFDGTGSQTSASGRWGDYSMTTIDPADNVSFWHTNEYYVTTGISWSTRIGKFRFPAAPRVNPTPRPRPTPAPRP